MFQGAAFGAVTSGSDVVLSLFELDALQQLKLSTCTEVRRWDVAPGPRALVGLADGFATGTSSAFTFVGRDGGASTVPTTPAPTALAAADLDADGKPELIATLGATAAEATVIVLRAGIRAQEFPITAASAVASADLDGDSDLDLVVARTTEHQLTLLTNTAGTLTRGQDLAVCEEPFAITTLRLATALPTIVVTCRTGGLELLRPDGAGGYVHQKLPRTGTLYDTAVADFDLDGNLDLASVDPFDHRLVFWWGKAGNLFEDPIEQATSLGPILLRAFEFDRGARPELLVLAFQDRSVTVFRHEETPR